MYSISSLEAINLFEKEMCVAERKSVYTNIDDNKSYVLSTLRMAVASALQIYSDCEVISFRNFHFR